MHALPRTRHAPRRPPELSRQPPEAVAYAAALALWQRRMVEQADAFVVPSPFARERLRALGAPLPWDRVHVVAPTVRALAGRNRPNAGRREPAQAAGGSAALPGAYALVVSRLAPEKGIDVAIDACRAAGMALVIAGDGPERRRAAGARRACGASREPPARPAGTFAGRTTPS